jgi:hypothetical protein
VQQSRIDHLRHMEKHGPGFSRLLAIELMNGASTLIDRGLHAEAEPVLRELVATVERDNLTRRDPDRMLMVAYSMLGHALLELERPVEAEPALRKAAGIDAAGGPRALTPGDIILAVGNLVRLARCRELAGDLEEALALVEQGSALIHGASGTVPGRDDLLRTVGKMRARLQEPQETDG